MSFWYTDAQDHTGAWYWIGIAISLSQHIGLHRSPQSTSRYQQPAEALQHLARRIWWTCVVRDRWLSLAKGRPMRIHHEDCDVAISVIEDVLNDLDRVSDSIRIRFIPTESRALADMWVSFVKISATLGSILRVHYRVGGPSPDVEDVNRHANELEAYAPKSIISEDSSDVLRLHAYQLDLFYQ